MSKVVRGVGRAVSKVVDGVKKFAKSKLGKVLIGAALVYFGGAALMGGMAAPAGSGISGFLSGASSGLSSAATGIGNAWGALTSGKGLTAAAGELGSGFMGTAGSAGSGIVGSGLSTPVVGATTGATPAGTLASSSLVPAAPVNYSLASGVPASGAGLSTVGANIAPTVGAGAANPGLISGAWNSLGPYGKAAAVSGGLQLGGAMYAKKEQEDATEAQRANYNRNIGGFRYA